MKLERFKYILISAEDLLTIFYADDAEAICSHIKTYFEEGRFRVQVSTVNINSDHGTLCTVPCSLGLVLLSPEMLHDLQRKPNNYLKSASAQCTKRAFLCHDSIDLCDRATEKILENSCSDVTLWNKISLGNASEDFKIALLNIMQLMESTPSANPVLLTYKINPKKISSAKEHIVVIFKKEVSKGDVFVHLHRNNFQKKIKCTELNALTYTFKPEGMPEGEITMEIFTNNISLGKTKFNICNKMDNFSSLVSDLVNPLEFFLQALDCDDTDSLDRELVDILTNGSMGNNPLAGLEAVDFRDSIWANKSSREYPTLLHIAAKLGLKQFCSTLQKFPGYQAAVCMKNKHNKTASQIALHAGHTDLASNIQPPENFAIFQDKDVQNGDSGGYMRMNQVTTVLYRRESTCTPPPLPRRSSESEEVVLRQSRNSQRDNTGSGASNISDSSLEDPFFNPRQMTSRMTQILEDNIIYCGNLTTKL